MFFFSKNMNQLRGSDSIPVNFKVNTKENTFSFRADQSILFLVDPEGKYIVPNFEGYEIDLTNRDPIVGAIVGAILTTGDEYFEPTSRFIEENIDRYGISSRNVIDIFTILSFFNVNSDILRIAAQTIFKKIFGSSIIPKNSSKYEELIDLVTLGLLNKELVQPMLSMVPYDKEFDILYKKYNVDLIRYKDNEFVIVAGRKFVSFPSVSLKTKDERPCNKVDVFSKHDMSEPVFSIRVHTLDDKDSLWGAKGVEIAFTLNAVVQDDWGRNFMKGGPYGLAKEFVVDNILLLGFSWSLPPQFIVDWRKYFMNTVHLHTLSENGKIVWTIKIEFNNDKQWDVENFQIIDTLIDIEAFFGLCARPGETTEQFLKNNKYEIVPSMKCQ